MKNLFLTSAFLLVLLLIGCQENSIIDPLSNEIINKEQTKADNMTYGNIPLEGLLVLHGGFQTYYTIDGQIEYTHQKVLIDPIPPAHQYYITIGLSVRANLNDGVDKLNIASSSHDQVYVSEDGILILEKVFEVVGGNDPLSLRCRFLVTTDGIGLNEMSLIQGYNATGNSSDKNIEPDPVTYPPVVNKMLN